MSVWKKRINKVPGLSLSRYSIAHQELQRTVKIHYTKTGKRNGRRAKESEKKEM